jgi:iron(III) transport system substrate-binding protein
VTGARPIRLVTLAAAALLAVAACAGTPDPAPPAAPSAPVSPAWQKVIDAARTEGSVTIYSSQGTDQLNDVATRFQQAYGVKVDVLRDVDANLEAKLDAEHGGSQKFADVAALADGTYVATKGQQGWWAPPTGADVAAPAYAGAAQPAADGSFITSAAVFVLGWNTQTVPRGLSSYADLLDPALAGKIGVNDPAISPAVVDFYRYLQEQNGAGFVDGLAGQRPQIFPSVLPMGQALLSGQISAMLGGAAPVTPKEQGAPVDFLVPKPAWGAAFRTAVLADAPHPNAAQLLANFLATPDGQAAIARDGASVLPGVPGALTTLADVRVFDAASLTPTQISDFRTEFRAKFQGGGTG